MDLKQIDPTTPTEFALLKHAKELERELSYMKMREDDFDGSIITPIQEFTVDSKVIKRSLYTPIALAEIRAVPYGQEVKITGKLDGTVEHYQVGYFVEEGVPRSKTDIANRMYDLTKETMKRISEIYA